MHLSGQSQRIFGAVKDGDLLGDKIKVRLVVDRSGKKVKPRVQESDKHQTEKEN